MALLNPVCIADEGADFARAQDRAADYQRAETNARRAQRNKYNAEARSPLSFVRVQRRDDHDDPDKAALYREQDERLAALRKRASAARPVISPLDTPLHAVPTTPPSHTGAIRAARLREARDAADASESALPTSPASQPISYRFRPTP